MIGALRLRGGSGRRRVKPAAHGHADEQCTGHDARDAYVLDRFDVVFGQSQPVDDRAYAQEDHAVPVGSLGAAGFLYRHRCNHNIVNQRLVWFVMINLFYRI